MTKTLVIKEILPLKPIARFIAGFFKNILILDNSLFTFSDQRDENLEFKNFLLQSHPNSKIEIIDPVECLSERFHANKESIVYITNCIEKHRQVKGFDFYYYGFLGRHFQPIIAKWFYLKKVLKKMGVKNFYILNFFPSKIGFLLTPFLYLLSPFVLFSFFVFTLLKKGRFSLKKISTNEGDICFDVVRGPKLLNGKINRSVVGDFAFNTEDLSPENTTFLAMVWGGAELKEWEKQYREVGSRVFGEKLGKIPYNFSDIITLFISTYSAYFKCLFKNSSGLTDNSFEHFWAKLKFCFFFLKVKLNFLHESPRSYLCQYDYSELHHIVGLVLSEKGTLFTGVCHSPLAEDGHTPNNGIISFDKFFIYSDEYPKTFFPAWNNAVTDLHVIGAWRADYCVEAKTYYSHEILAVRAKIKENFVVAIHLPVPKSCTFSEDDTKRWLHTFDKIFSEEPEIGFVLFPRRYDGSPEYFKNWVNEKLESTNCYLGSTLQKEWDYFYPWVNVCDFVVGCVFSDVVAESFACGVPAVSYSDFSGVNMELEKIDQNLSVYDYEGLCRVLRAVKNCQWPPEQLMSEMQKKITGVAHGKFREEMTKALVRGALN